MIDRGLERSDHLVLIGRRGDDIVEIAARHHRVEEGRLRFDTPGRRNLRDNVDAKILRRLFHSELHDLVERIDDPRQKSDLELLGRGAVRRKRQGERRRHG